MNELTIARAIHVLSIVIWIGGVGFVTLVLLPSIKKSSFKNEYLSMFNNLASQFSSIARVDVARRFLS